MMLQSACSLNPAFFTDSSNAAYMTRHAFIIYSQLVGLKKSFLYVFEKMSKVMRVNVRVTFYDLSPSRRPQYGPEIITNVVGLFLLIEIELEPRKRS